VKRLGDILAALGLLVILGPLACMIALAIRWRMGPPVLFRQPRLGRHERTFVVLKFRTMREEPGAPDEQRLTLLGRWLRRTSLDEVPQLINVLRGEMSFIGPRPLLTRYQPYYSPRERRRHEVRPGLTGWAQIHGRNRLGWEERLRLDVWYVAHWSLELDLLVLLRTLGAVMRGQGFRVSPPPGLRDLDIERRKAPCLTP
jgi:lipopolysaccharide/colanic/teichoic acid biosynthesis glycosyltransferase